MQILNVSEKKQELTRVRTEHNSEFIDWVVPIYRRNNFKDLGILFNPINNFWASLPKARQDAIWVCYKEIYETLTNISDLNRLYLRLKKAVANLYQCFTQQDIATWVRGNVNIVIPSNIFETYDDKPQERTYLREDYYQLALLSISLQPMIPVFGDYIERIGKQVGNNYKEQHAMGTMSETWVIADVARLRLKEYVEAFVQYEKTSNAAIYRGLGTTELPDWLLCKALVRKVAIGEVSVADNNTSIISNVYHYLKSNVDSLDRNFSKGRITEKGHPVDGGGGDEDNVSYAETYKVKQEVSDGDIVMLSVYAKNTVRMAKKVDPSIPTALVNLCVKGMKVLEHEPIETHQMVLTQWVMARSLSARAIPSLTKPALLKTMGVTQALLFHWGYPNLAALMVGRPYVREDDYALFSTDPRVRIPKDMVVKLFDLYPYAQRVGGKPQSDRQSNSACRAIELLAYELSKNYWTVHLPDDLKVGVQMVSTNCMVAPPDVKGQLAKLIVERVIGEVAVVSADTI